MGGMDESDKIRLVMERWVVLGPVSDTAEEPDHWEPVGREDKRTRPVGVR